jgi:hypothetical protein
MDDARQALERLDAFIGGVVAHMTTDTLLFVVSDHGNIEDIRTGHTRNAAIGLVAGAATRCWRAVSLASWTWRRRSSTCSSSNRERERDRKRLRKRNDQSERRVSASPASSSSSVP